MEAKGGIRTFLKEQALMTEMAANSNMRMKM